VSKAYQRKPKKPLPRNHPKYTQVCHHCWDEPVNTSSKYCLAKFFGKNCFKLRNRKYHNGQRARRRANGDTCICRLCGNEMPWSPDLQCSACKSHHPMFKQFWKNAQARKRKEAAERWPYWVERAFTKPKDRGPMPEILRRARRKHSPCHASWPRRMRGYKWWYGRVRGEVRRSLSGNTRSKNGHKELKVPDIHRIGDYLRKKYFEKKRKQESLAAMRSGPRVGYQNTM
jgi:ubiquitin